MKNRFKTLGVILALGVLTLTITAFVISDPKANFQLHDLSGFDKISLTEIESNNSQNGMFKTSVTFCQKAHQTDVPEFYGQEIRIKDNEQLDKIRIGVTNQLISRVEIWNKDELVEIKKLGFMDKMTWGEEQEISVEFYDQTNSKYPGQSRISMRFYNGSGFFGDIGTLSFDLTDYGDLSGAKDISLFAQTSAPVKPVFKNIRVWKNFNSFD